MKGEIHDSETSLRARSCQTRPEAYKVELENDRVRVVRMRYSGREKLVMHQHPPGIGVFLTDASFKFSYPDGKTENIQAKAGEYQWFGEVWEHDPENLSDKNAEVIYVELKR